MEPAVSAVFSPKLEGLVDSIKDRFTGPAARDVPVLHEQYDEAKHMAAAATYCSRRSSSLRLAAGRNSSCSRSRLIGSMAPNGSSISSTAGSAPSARATPTRWRCPPDSWLGYRSRYVGRVEPDQVEQLVDAGPHLLLRPAEQAWHGGDVGTDGLMREQTDLLDHVADVAAQLDRIDLA